MCKCENCGKEFKKEKICRNRAEADSFEEWAKENCTECHECYKARIEAEKAEKIKGISEEITFPTLTAVSDKQMSFAEKKRNEYVVENTDLIKKMYAFMNMPEERRKDIEKKCIEKGTTFEVEYEKLINKFKKAYTILTETNAGKLLDVIA